APSCLLMSGTATLTTLLSIIDSSEPESRTKSATGESRGALSGTFASWELGHGTVDGEQASVELVVARGIPVFEPGHDADVRGGAARPGDPPPHDPIGLDRLQLSLGHAYRCLVPAGRDVGELGLSRGMPEQQGEPVRVGPCRRDQVAQRGVA